MKISKDRNEKHESISHKIKFLSSSRFMASLLSSLVGNLTEGIHKIKCRGFGCCLEYESVNKNLIKQKGLSCNLNYSKKLNDKLKKKFQNTFKFSNNDINKIILLLRKDLYRYEYLDDWEKFNETTLPEKEFLNIEDITDADYAHAKRVCKDFEIENVGEYNDLYLNSDTLLLADVFENYRKTCLEIYELHLAKFVSAPGLAWQAALKKTEVELDLLTDIDMLLGVEEGIGGKYVMQFISMQKLIINI